MKNHPRKGFNILFSEAKFFSFESKKQYSGKSAAFTAEAMKIVAPNTKIIAIACDPIPRVFSQFKMKDRRTEIKKENGDSEMELKRCRACLKGGLEEEIKVFTDEVKSKLENPVDGKTESIGFDEYVHAITPFIEQFG